MRALHKLVESGTTEPDDPFLQESVAKLKLGLASIADQIGALNRQLGAKLNKITPEKVDKLAAAMRAGVSAPTVHKRGVAMSVHS